MKKTIKKLFFGASAVALVAMALAPITACLGSDSAYAADAEKTSNFSVTISSTLSLEVTTPPNKLTLSAGTKDENGTFTATVKSNKGYNILLSATEPALKSGNNEIPAVAGFSETVKGWAIKDKTASGTPYKAITTTDVVYFKSESATTNSAGDPTTFNWGVGVDYSVPDGEYSTTVKVTATTV